MERAFRIGGLVVGGAFAAVVAAVAGLVAMVGLIFLVLWIQEPTAGAYAHSQVQSLFINDARKPTGKVESCRTIGDVDPDQKIWACRVAGQGCVRTFEFVVDHEYGTQPYDNRSSAATDNPCGVKSD